MTPTFAQVYTPEALEDGLESAAASFVESEDVSCSALLQLITKACCICLVSRQPSSHPASQY